MQWTHANSRVVCGLLPLLLAGCYSYSPYGGYPGMYGRPPMGVGPGGPNLLAGPRRGGLSPGGVEVKVALGNSHREKALRHLYAHLPPSPTDPVEEGADHNIPHLAIMFNCRSASPSFPSVGADSFAAAATGPTRATPSTE